MKLMILAMIVAAALMVAFAGPSHAESKAVPKMYTFEAKSIDGADVKLDKYAGKVMLVVNVASKCGFTKHYAGLQALHEKHAEKGLAILGFPCNQFGGQEPGSEEDIKAFCESKYGVKFDLFAKIDVNGENAHPLYKYLTSDELPIADKGPIKWNFEKFLVDREGKVIARYRREVTPEQIEADIVKLLGA